MTNAKISILAEGKIHVEFPKKGYLNIGKSQFKDIPEIITYLSGILKIKPKDKETLEGSIKRTGKYQRLDKNGKPALTFGDVILDLITDESGMCKVGTKEISFYHLMITENTLKGGVLTRINPAAAKLAAEQEFLRALAETSPYEVLNANDTSFTIVSKNPAKATFQNEKHTVKFKAWRTHFLFYFNEGSELDIVRGPDFKNASIASSYFKSIPASQPGGPTCVNIKNDTDTDTNDDYLEESEFAIAVGTSSVKPSGHHSFCKASWDPLEDSATAIVNKGGCSTFGL